MSEELERIGLEAVFEREGFSKEAKAYTTDLRKANSETAKAAAGMAKSMTAASTEIDRSWHNIAGALLDGGASVKEVGDALSVSKQEVIDYAQASGRAATDSVQAAAAADKQAQATERVGEATKKTTSYIGRYLKRLALWVTIGATVRGAIRGITTAFKDGFSAIFANREEYEHLTTAYDRFKNSVVLSLLPLDQTLKLMEKLTAQANKLADALEREQARRAVGKEPLQEIHAVAMKEPERFSDEDWQKIMGMYWSPSVLSERQVQLLADINEKYKLGVDVLGVYNDKLTETREITQGNADAQQRMADATADLSKILQAADEELDRHALATSLVHGAYDEEAAQAVIDFWAENERITEESLADIAKIEAEAAADIEKIRTKAIHRIEELEQRTRKSREHDEERHQLQMQFRRRRFELTAIQGERMYQSRRRRLVAEGDVLGIEQLDEDYELQRQAAEENFNLQMEQAEAMYRLQARIQEESMAAQIQMLRRAMQEQIAEVERAKQAEIEEAEAAAAAEIELNEAKRDQMLIDARESRDQELADETAAHKRRMEAIAEQITEFMNKYDIEFDLMDAVVERHFGEGSPMDMAVRESFNRMKQYAADAAAYVNSLMGSIGGGGPGGRRPYNPRPPRGVTREAGTTGGRSEIYSKPTLIEVAEGRAERVSVQPLYSGGSPAMSLSWSGGPIPIRGEGSISGADLDALGSGITIAIVSKMQQSYQGMHTPAG